MQSRAGSIAGGVQAGKPTRPCSNNTTALAIDGKSANGVSDGWCKRDCLAFHVNTGALSDRSEERAPPRLSLAQLACVENRLNGCQDGFGNFDGRFASRLNGRPGGFVQLGTVVEQACG